MGFCVLTSSSMRGTNSSPYTNPSLEESVSWLLSTWYGNFFPHHFSIVEHETRFPCRKEREFFPSGKSDLWNENRNLKNS